MNTYEKAIQDSLESIQTQPSDALRNRVMLSAVSGAVDSHEYRRRFPVRAAVLCAIIAALFLTTAATFGNEIVGAIRQVIFGDSIATQVDSDNDLYIGTFGVRNRTDLSDATDYPIGSFDTLEEAKQAAPFPIREPSYLPDNVTGFHSAGVWRVETTETPWMHFVILSYNIALENGGVSILQLIQTYAGPDAYVVIENVSPMEKVMVGGSEALLISAPEKFVLDDGTVIVNHDVIRYTLYWLNDGVAFELEAWYHDGYTPETMIKIAESMG